MRFLGVWLLGFGIVFLIMDGVALASVNSLKEVLGLLACGALVPVPMIIAGITLVRRAEERQARADADEARAASPGGPAERVAEGPEEWLRRTRTRMMHFDLTRLNGVGWLLLLATFGFALAEAGLAVLLLGDWGPGNRWAAKVVAFPILLLALGFFFGVRWLLGVLGVTIYRR